MINRSSTYSLEFPKSYSKQNSFVIIDVNLLQYHRQQSPNLLHYLPMIPLIFLLIVHLHSCVVFANIVAILYEECVCILNFIFPIMNPVRMMILSLHRQSTILYQHHHHHHHHRLLNCYLNVPYVRRCSTMKIH